MAPNLDSPSALGTLKLGAGVSVEKVEQAGPDHMTVQIHVAADAPTGKRDVQIGAAKTIGSLTVYDHADYIRVLPEKSLARLGGVRAVKRLIQFEAHAFSNGPDHIPGNADDVDLGMVKAAWSLGESVSMPNDEDTKYVGVIDQDGLFTPAQEGPNPEAAAQHE